VKWTLRGNGVAILGTVFKDRECWADFISRNEQLAG
jgi:hypothetical protein